MPIIAPAASWLLVVAETGSIRRAATRLNLSPSAVNRQILNLEAEYGAALFERLPRGMRLTPAGQMVAAEIQRWQHDHAQLVQHIGQLRSMVRGHASLGLMESFSRTVVSRLMSHMRERQSLVSLEVLMGGTAEIVDRLVAGKLDLAICYAVPKLPEIRVLASIQPSSGIVVARDHPLAGRKSIRLAECANYSFVFPDSSLTSRRILETALERAKVHFAGVVTTNSVEVMKMLVREHRQIALLSLPDIGADLADRDLVHIPLADRHVRGSHLSLIAPRHAKPSPVATMLAEFLREELQGLPARRAWTGSLREVGGTKAGRTRS